MKKPEKLLNILKTPTQHSKLENQSKNIRALKDIVTQNIKGNLKTIGTSYQPMIA